MERRRILLLGIGISILICLALALLGAVLYRGQRERALAHRPLVLIHAPLSRDRVPLGSGVLVHATARVGNGVSRVELWSDDALVAARDHPQDGLPYTLSLATEWKPQTPGPHVLLVRAFSADGVAGQSTVAIEVVPAGVGREESLGSYLVREEGETLEGVAEAVGADPEELEDLNPGLEDLYPGDVVIYPDDESAGAEEPASEDEPPAEGGAPADGAGPTGPDEVPPDPGARAPGSFFGVLDLWGVIPLPELAEEPVQLQVEALSLESGGTYELLHCYVGVGEEDPRWIPDADSDQTTDESFAPLGDGQWDVATHLAGEQAFLLTWPGDAPLPISLSCVGVVDGATDAVELGQLEITARPEAWDGLTRRAVAASDEGAFSLDYRVSQVGGAGRGHPIFLDPTMTPPTSLRMGAWTLHWEYEPRADEEPIHGFRVYLNGALQWVEPPDARYSTLPYEWLSPPCGEAYDFTVTAFRYGYPDGPESPSSNVVSISTGEPGDEACNRTFIVTFDTLTTYELPGDGERDPGDVGPVYGTFWAGDQSISFDGRCDGPGICGVFALRHDSEYDINTITSHYGPGPARLVVDLPPGEDLEVGFEITDGDTGWRNEDDHVCGEWRYVWDSELDSVVESGVEDWYVCDVSFLVEPAFGSPVAGPDGRPPLPLLAVEDLTVREETGQLQIHVRNVGAGTWPAKDLDMAVTWPDGSAVGAYTWPELILQPGERAILEHPDLVPAPHPPLGACVLLDPGNSVPEEDDYSVGWRRGRYCRPLPDLTITDVQYDADGERLLVTVENIGEGSVEHRDLGLEIVMADGRYFSAPAEWWADVSIEPRGAIVMVWENIGPDQRALMMDGYTAVIDPHNDIAEE
ncbi:MAG: LysM domain-containing protein, partial [Anaerolineae bacterium]